jgi:Phytanoyl-CoA dioxygenase (PhyH)
VVSVTTSENRRSWNTDGWFVLERALPLEALHAAQRACTKLFPSAAEMAERSGKAANDRWRTWDAPWPEFPFRSSSLNALVLGEIVMDCAQELLGTSDVRLYLALASAKYAGQPSDFNQLFHTDYPNHTLTVPQSGRRCDQVEMFLYLSDVSRDNGATCFVSRQRTLGVPIERHTLGFDEYPDLYDDPIDASAPAGSIVVYRPDVYHRSVDFSDPARVRFMLHAAFRPADMDWGGYQAWPIKGYAPEWHSFVTRANPRQLTALGFPPPGHPFWTDEALEGVGRRYPGLDLGPWYRAQER